MHPSKPWVSALEHCRLETSGKRLIMYFWKRLNAAFAGLKLPEPVPEVMMRRESQPSLRKQADRGSRQKCIRVYQTCY